MHRSCSSSFHMKVCCSFTDSACFVNVNGMRHFLITRWSYLMFWYDSVMLVCVTIPNAALLTSWVYTTMKMSAKVRRLFNNMRRWATVARYKLVGVSVTFFFVIYVVWIYNRKRNWNIIMWKDLFRLKKGVHGLNIAPLSDFLISRFP